jgi:glycosyltransferase involved in cell wall biosynthesis
VRVAIYLPSLRSGGVEKVMVALVRGFCKRGLDVDLVLAKAVGPFLTQVPCEARIIDLNASRVLSSLPSLVSYLRSARPVGLVSAMDHANVVALIAKRLAGVRTCTIATVHSHLTSSVAGESSLKARLTPFWIRPFYPWADAVVAVSKGVADDLVRVSKLPLTKVKVIYNPVVTSELFLKAAESVNHPWFQVGAPPVVLAVGRLTAPKDFPTLIRAFAGVRTRRTARLMILGEGEARDTLTSLARSLGVDQDVALPGFVSNPFSYMRASAVFVLSSRWEGFANVLAEAMACGTPVVSTDCPSGPAEILEAGRWGPLVPVGDAHAMTAAILSQLNSGRPPGMVDSVTARFHEDRIVNEYLELLFPEAVGAPIYRPMAPPKELPRG